ARESSQPNGLLRPQMEITLRQVHSTAAFRNKRMRVRMFTPRRIELQSRAVGDPHRRNSGMIQRSRELIQAGNAPAARRNQPIDSDIQNARRLTQSRLQSGALFYTEMPTSANTPHDKYRRIARK